jgi:hypothetical protein
MSGEYEKCEPSNEDWTSMETAIGRDIVDNLKVEITRIVQNYFRKHSFEVNAPFLDDVVEHLDVISETTKQLKDALSASNSAVDLVRAQLAQGFEETNSDPIESLEAKLEALSHAAWLARGDFTESKDGFSEGHAWQEMVRSLKSLMCLYSMPAGASQDSSKAISPFVQFIQSLQKTFPSESLRRHHLGTPFALAKEINRAVQAGKIGT